MKILYTTTAKSTHGREGTARSEDDKLSVKLAPPKEMGGSGDGTNPEQLFAAGYAACFANAIIYLARQQKLALKQSTVSAEVSLGQYENGTFGLKVGLKVEIEGIAESAAQALIDEADRYCPYSNAIRGNVEKTIARI